VRTKFKTREYTTAMLSKMHARLHAHAHTHAQPHESDCDRRPWEGTPNGERGSLPKQRFSRSPHEKTSPQILYAVPEAAEPEFEVLMEQPPPRDAHTHVQTHTHRLTGSNRKRHSSAAADKAHTHVPATNLGRGAGRPRDGGVEVGGCPTATAVEGVIVRIVWVCPVSQRRLAIPARGSSSQLRKAERGPRYVRSPRRDNAALPRPALHMRDIRSAASRARAV
jgi:hypothetical protein